jgi:succinoglycan biosynthesis protein ExoV
MHGAIVADTMRIPWIPVTMNPNVPAFKWNDWGQALRVPFAPHDLGGSSFFEALRHRMIVRQAAQQGSVPAGLVSSDTVDALVTDHLQRHETKTGPTKRHWYEAESVRELARKSTRLMDPFFVQQATRRLRNIDLEKCYLSSDLIFQQKLEQLIEAKDVLVRELLG